MTDKYSVSLYLNTAAESFRDYNQNPAVDTSNFEFNEISFENRYMLLNPADHAVGLTFYLEPGYSGSEAEIEEKIISVNESATGNGRSTWSTRRSGRTTSIRSKANWRSISAFPATSVRAGLSVLNCATTTNCPTTVNGKTPPCSSGRRSVTDRKNGGPP